MAPQPKGEQDDITSAMAEKPTTAEDEQKRSPAEGEADLSESAVFDDAAKAIIQAEDEIRVIAEQAESGQFSDFETEERLDEVGAELERLNISFTDKLARILGRPRELARGWFDKREKAQLAIPDNPKIIAKIERIIYAIREIQSRQIIEQRKKTDKEKTSASDSEEKIIRMMTKINELGGRIIIQDEEKWEKLGHRVETLLADLINQRVHRGDVEAALCIWNSLPETERHVSDATKSMVAAIINEHGKPPAAEHGRYMDNFLKRRAYLRGMDEYMANRLRDCPELLSYYQNQLKQRVSCEMFTDINRMRFLLEQPEDVINALAALPAEQQEYAVFMLNNSSDFIEIITAANGREIITFMMEIPEGAQYNKGDKEKIEKIMRIFSPEERASVWNKIKIAFTRGHSFNEKADWDIIYSYFYLARNTPDMSQKEFNLLHRQGVNLAVASLIAFGEEKCAVFTKSDDLAYLFDSEYRYYLNDEHYSDDSHEILQFIRDLSPALKQYIPSDIRRDYNRHPLHGGSKSASEQNGDQPGFSDSLRELRKLMWMVNRVPESLREKFFSCLRPPESFDSYDFNPKQPKPIFETQCANFFEYSELCGDKNRLSYADFVFFDKYFLAERWAGVKKGMRIFFDAGLGEKIDIRDKGSFGNNWFEIFEQAGKAEMSEVNELVKLFLSGSENIADQPHRQGEWKTRKRNTGDVLRLYDFKGWCDSCCRVDNDLMIDYVASVCNLENVEKKALAVFLDGSLARDKTRYADISLVEGAIAEVDRAVSFKEGSNQLKCLQEFSRFSREQKLQFIRLNKCEHDYMDGQRLYEEVKSGDAAKVIDLLSDAHFEQFDLKTLFLMAARSDCVDLFHFLHGRGENQYKLPEAVQKIIALRDAGLPASFGKGRPRDDSSSRNWLVEEICNCDVEKVMKKTRIAAVVLLEPNLEQLFDLSDEEPDDIINKRVLLAKVTGDDLYLQQYGIGKESLDEPENVRKKLEETARVCGRELTKEEKRKIVDTREIAWQKLSSLNLIQRFVESNTRYFTDAHAALSDDILLNPLFWQSECPYAILGDEQLIRSFLPAREKLAGIGVNTYDWGRNIDECRMVCHAVETAPWLLEQGALEWMMARIEFYDIVQLAEFSRDDFYIMASFGADLFALSQSPYNRDYGAFLKFIEGLAPLEEQTFIGLRQQLGARVPFSSCEKIREMLAAGADVDAIISQLDAVDDDSRHQAMNDWRQARLAGALAPAGEAINPTLRKYLCESDLLGGYPIFIRNKEFAEKIAELSPLEMERLGKLEGFLADLSSWRQELTPNLFIVVKSENFDAIAALLRDNFYRAQIMEAPAEKVEYFCKNLTAEMAGRVGAIPAYVNYQLIDIPDFFNCPQAEKALEFAGELKKLLGEEFNVSIYDLMLMDYAGDLANINSLRKKCFAGVSKETLPMLSEVLEGEEQNTMRKVRAIFEWSSSLDASATIEKIQGLSPRFCLTILKQKIRNFGWDMFMKHRDQLVSTLGFQQEEIDELAFESLRRLGAGDFTSIDYPTAAILMRITEERGWANSRNVYSNDLLMNIIHTFQGTDEELVEIMGQNEIMLAEFFINKWPNIPAKVRYTAAVMELALRFAPAVLVGELVNNFEKLPPNFLTKERVGALAAGILERDDAINMELLFSLILGEKISLDGEQLIQFIDACLEKKRSASLIFELFQQKKVILSEERLKKTVDVYILNGLKLDFLQPKEIMAGAGEAEEETDSVREKRRIFQDRLNEILDNWRYDRELAMSAIEKITASEVFDPRCLAINLEIVTEEKNVKEPNEVFVARAQRALVDSIVMFDPTVRRTFTDPAKLGMLKNVVEANTVAFVDKLHKEWGQKIMEASRAGVSEDKIDGMLVEMGRDMVEKVRSKLKEVRRIFESSDSSESARRLIFLDTFNLSTCHDPDERVAEVKNDKEAMKKLVAEDLREVLAASGSRREVSFLQRELETNHDLSPEEKARYKQFIHESKESVKSADKRNRDIYKQAMAAKQEYQTAMESAWKDEERAKLKKTLEQKLADIFMPEGALTHGASSASMRLILEDGNFTGELLGSASRSDASGALGVDVAKVMDSEAKTLTERYSALVNQSYGDVLLVCGEYSRQNQGGASESAVNKRTPYPSGVIVPGHELVRTGIASSEITAMIMRRADDNTIKQLKKDNAAKGFYIPILNTAGEVLFSPEEFDVLKVFYFTLNRKGYPREIIDNVFAYFSGQRGKDDTKHAVVINKAFEYLKTRMNEVEKAEDMVILVDFLKNNPLNARSFEDYKAAKFEEIMKWIKASVGKKGRGKARRLLFNQPLDEAKAAEEAAPIYGSIADRIAELNRLKKENAGVFPRQAHDFIDNFFEKQLPFSMGGGEASARDVKLYERALTDLMFAKSNSRQIVIPARPTLYNTDGSVRKDKAGIQGGEVADSRFRGNDKKKGYTRILETARLFSEQKAEMMKKLWEMAWQSIESDARVAERMPAKKLRRYKQMVIPAISGSGGRGDAVLGSDLDFLLYVDDVGEALTPDEMKELEYLVNSILSERLKALLREKGVIADAGLARAGERPFVLFSSVRDFQLDLQARRQAEEPTIIVDSQPLFPESADDIGRVKELLLSENKSAGMLDSFILSDLEIGRGDRQSFIAQFEALYKSAASEGFVQRIKESLQRVINFKIYHLLFTGLNNSRKGEAVSASIPLSEARNVPADTVGKLSFLRKYHVLSGREEAICKNLLAFSYKLRFLGEIYSEEAPEEGRIRKIHNVQFRLEDLSYEERGELIGLLKDFKDEVLYK